MFGEDASNPSVCPGERNCQRFQSAAGADREAKIANACSGCELLPTKLDGGSADKAMKQLVRSARAIRAEMVAGYPRPGWAMTFKEFRIYVMLSDAIDQHRLTMERESHMFQMKTAGYERR